jgi:hypothetical protein
MPHYTTNTSKIAFESFETEVVLVNLDTGHYYVLSGTAGVLWRLLLAGLSPDEIGAALTARYDGAPDEMAAAAQAFADDLVQDALLIAVEQAGTPLDSSILGELAATTTKVPFEPPSMFKYTEMENLILMDPIREVDETGWPERRNFPKKAN